MNDKKFKLISASAIAAMAAIAFAAVITIWAEFSAGLKASLKNFSGHHWVTKSIGIAAVYAAFLLVGYVLPRQVSSETVRRRIWQLLWVTMLGGAAIFGFFVWHYFSA